MYTKQYLPVACELGVVNTVRPVCVLLTAEVGGAVDVSVRHDENITKSRNAFIDAYL